MNERCAALLEAQREGFRRRVEQRREAIKVATAKARAAHDPPVNEALPTEAAEDDHAALSVDAGTHGEPTANVQPDEADTSGQPSLPLAYMKCVNLPGLSIFLIFFLCRCGYFALSQFKFIWTPTCTSRAGILMYLLCSTMQLLVLMTIGFMHRCTSASGFLHESVRPLIVQLPRAWKRIWSYIFSLFDTGLEQLTRRICNLLLSPDFSLQRTTPFSVCEPSGPKSRADPHLDLFVFVFLFCPDGSVFSYYSSHFRGSEERGLPLTPQRQDRRSILRLRQAAEDFCLRLRKEHFTEPSGGRKLLVVLSTKVDGARPDL